MEMDEDHSEVATREVREETGAVVSIRITDGCIANTEEFRNDLHQISYALGKPELTEEELVDGLTHGRVPARQALDKMGPVGTNVGSGPVYQERDFYLLGEAIRKSQI
ncbi:hypothetical protein F4782DRAFT_511657 [Xylaria castorea]|nr:hypothetical protein F4782DRAFT_511657 [Xylaria castorea]